MWEGEIIAKNKEGDDFLSLTLITEIVETQRKGAGKLYISQNVTQKRHQEREDRINEQAALRRHVAEQISVIIGKEIKRLSDFFETLPVELDEINLSKSQKTIDIMKNSIENIKELISGWSTSSWLEAPREPLNLVNFFEEELRLLKTQKKFQDIVFATSLEEGTPQVKANKWQLQQLFYAILDNSANALQSVSDRKKTITIEVGGVNQKQEVQILISDNGMGMSPANLSKVFKENFTTKPNGLGLGLLSVSRIVKNHEGQIEIHSDEGTYTLIVIKLPAYEEKSAFVPQAEPACKPRS